MKLNFAENLRKLRRDNELTQEQLAEKLEVAFQTVSHWETETNYPDIEMLPTIAEFFDVSVDELLGCDKLRREQELEEMWEKYYQFTDIEEQYIYIKQMYEKFPRNWHVTEAFCWMISRLFPNPDEPTLNLFRRISTELLDNCSDVNLRANVIEYTIIIENDDNLSLVKDKYNLSDGVLGYNDLLEKRYFNREEWEKYDEVRQKNLLRDLEYMFMLRLRKKTWDASVSLWSQEKILQIINLLSDGDTEINAWIEYRIFYGLRYSCALASSDKIEEGLTTLEEIIDLLEKYYKIPEGTKLSYNCLTLDKLSANAKEIYFCDVKHVLFILTATQGWEWFDPIRNDERFIRCVERVRALTL